MFIDRADAGRQLARELFKYRQNPAAVVIALPRGGVPVAAEVSRALGLPLDILVVRKLGLPGQEELAMGAIASGGTLFLNQEIVDACGITPDRIRAAAEREGCEIARRESLYRGDSARLALTGKVVLLVDDGLATGATMRAAVGAIRAEKPSRVVAAVPVGAAQSCAVLSREADELVCLAQPEPFVAVGAWYQVFDQTSDREVIDCLQQARRSVGPAIR